MAKFIFRELKSAKSTWSNNIFAIVCQWDSSIVSLLLFQLKFLLKTPKQSRRPRCRKTEFSHYTGSLSLIILGPETQDSSHDK